MTNQNLEMYMKNKKLLWLFGSLSVAIVCLITVCVISLCTAARVIKDNAKATENADISDIMTVETDGEPIYFLREHEGRIGIFSEDNTLIETLDVYLITLPRADRVALSEGITVKGTENLNALKEDYTG